MSEIAFCNGERDGTLERVTSTFTLIDAGLREEILAKVKNYGLTLGLTRYDEAKQRG